jgi:hypothetical protein
MLVAAALAGPASAAELVPSDPRPLGSLRDDSGLLGRGAGLATLRARVADAAMRAGLPVVIVLVGTVDSPRELAPARLEETARARFAEQGLSEGTDDAVLLLVAPRAGQAVLETGKGEAGIVPEIDARRITAALTRTLGRHASPATLGRALAEAADRVADSVLATRDRRRPLAEPPGGVIEAEGEHVLAPSPARDQATRAAGDQGGAAAARHRSLMPGAYALAIFVMGGLALRQRRRFGAEGRPRAIRRP